MARIKKGLLSKRVVGRGGGAPGSYSKSWESRQHEAIGKAAKKYMADKKGKIADGGKAGAKNTIDTLERRSSISASKYRERYRSKKK